MTKILSVEDGAAVITAVAYTVLYIEGVNQAVFVTFLKKFSHLFKCKVTGHAMLYGPPAQFAGVKAGFGYVLTMVARICQPVCNAARAWGNTPVAFLS